MTRPATCTEVSAGDSLQHALASAPANTVLCLTPGQHHGPIVIDKPITLWGPREATITGHGQGSVITIHSPNTRILNLSIDGHGGRYDREDAAILVRADDVRIEGVRIHDAVFGILANQVHRLTIADSDIAGTANAPLGLRGDGIRLWETYDSQVLRNRLHDGRDLVVWYSPHNLFADNVVMGGRYGTHFMHASDNVVRGGHYLGNVVGVFVMYSHRITIADSEFFDCSAAGGMGVGIKDSGDVRITRSRFARNSAGVYIDNSPSLVTEKNDLADNRFQLNDAALVFHGVTTGNAIRANDFASNRDQVLVEGGGDALAAHFHDNRYDDYRGYDFDGDGLGDVPHEVRTLAGELTSTHTALAFFRGTPSYGVIEALGRLVPLFAPKALFRDLTPRLNFPAQELRHVH